MQIEDADIKYIAYNWFRDEGGLDESIVDQISIGETMACVLWSGLVSVCRYYEEFSRYASKCSIIEVAEDSSNLRVQIASYFGDVVKSNPKTNHYQNDESMLSHSHLPLVRTSRLFRVLQYPIARKTRGRTLYIANWMMHNEAELDPRSIMLFRRSFMRGAAPILKRRNMDRGKKIFPSTLDSNSVRDKFQKVLESKNIEWDELLISICATYTCELYNKMQPSLVKCYALYLDLIQTYSPVRCYVPSDAFPSWLIVYQLCRSHGIQTTSYVDGYPLIPIWPISRNPEGDDWLVDEVLAYGDAQLKMISSLNFPANQIRLVNPPISAFCISGIPQKKYDLIIMSWFANCYSIEGDHVSTVTTMRDALDVAVRLKVKNIGIKIKTSEERKYIEPLIRDLSVSVFVQILEGKFIDFAPLAHGVIGGISSAMAEATIANVPYFLYEPDANGYSDSFIAKSTVIDKDMLARTPAQLFNLVKDGRSSWTTPISQLIGKTDI
jgi:hypothetical protein